MAAHGRKANRSGAIPTAASQLQFQAVPTKMAPPEEERATPTTKIVANGGEQVPGQ